MVRPWPESLTWCDGLDDRLQQMLKAHAKVKEINEARQDEVKVINEK